MLRWNLLLAGVLSFYGCMTVPKTENLPSSIQRLDQGTRQVIVVEAVSPGSFKARLTAWERGSKGWQPVLSVMSAVIGRTGFTGLDQKREGDGHTPSGIYKLETAFGDEPEIKTGLAYRRATENDFWVDDPQSSQYNQWVTGIPAAKSFEKLKRSDGLYKYAAVIEYNTLPVVSGNGSAIFFHIWRGEDQPTAGCVAVSEKNIKRLLHWLNKSAQPVVILGAI